MEIEDYSLAPLVMELGGVKKTKEGRKGRKEKGR